MKTKDMPSVRGRKVAIGARERLWRYPILRCSGMDSRPIESELLSAFMAGYRHAKKLEKQQ